LFGTKSLLYIIPVGVAGRSGGRSCRIADCPVTVPGIRPLTRLIAWLIPGCFAYPKGEPVHWGFCGVMPLVLSHHMHRKPMPLRPNKSPQQVIIRA
jgi:hypothetical protein